MNFLVLQPKILLQQTQRFVDRTKHFVVTKYFISILTNDFVGITKPFLPWITGKTGIVIKATDFFYP